MVSVIWNQFCIEKSRWERESCPLSGIEKRPPLGGYASIKVMLDTIRYTMVVRYREAVLFSEGPLSEARLYYLLTSYKINFLGYTMLTIKMALIFNSMQSLLY